MALTEEQMRGLETHARTHSLRNAAPGRTNALNRHDEETGGECTIAARMPEVQEQVYRLQQICQEIHSAIGSLEERLHGVARSQGPIQCDDQAEKRIPLVPMAEMLREVADTSHEAIFRLRSLESRIEL